MKNERLEKAKDAVAKSFGYEDVNHAIYGDMLRAGISPGHLSAFIDSVATTYADNQWIDVKEQLPDLETTILLSISNYKDKYITIGFMDKNERFYDESDEFGDTVNPTHWMPLPEPPKSK